MTPGGQARYSDVAIEAAVMVRLVFHQPLRQTEGLLGSLLELMGLDLPVPDHTTISRRAALTTASRLTGRWPNAIPRPGWSSRPGSPRWWDPPPNRASA